MPKCRYLTGLKSGLVPPAITTTSSDIWHKVRGQLNLVEPQLGDTTQPFDAASFRPVAGSALIDAGKRSTASPVSLVLSHQIDALGLPQLRRMSGLGHDLGAVER